MEYFRLRKSKKRFYLEKNLDLKNGYAFNSNLKITLYQPKIIEHVLTQKIGKSLHNIIHLYLYIDLETDGSDESANLELEIKLETLKKILLEKYSIYLPINKIKSYLEKLEKIENKVFNKKNKTY